jgi:hypothetical protein
MYNYFLYMYFIWKYRHIIEYGISGLSYTHQAYLYITNVETEKVKNDEDWVLCDSSEENELIFKN